MLATSPKPGPKSLAEWGACATLQEVEAFLDDLSPNALASLPYLFEHWALPHQRPPKGVWSSWVILGGRGAGKTRAGSEWVRKQVEGNLPLDKGKCRKLALVGETIDQAREVMVFGESGILACSPPDRRPEWVAGRKMLIWPNGAQAQLFSAYDPDSLRGPQFDGAWCDELAKWKKVGDCWDMLQFGLRLGAHPQCVVTTTPRDCDILRMILDLDGTRMTQAPTDANRAFLAKSFLEVVRARYDGTAIGRQELDGELLSEREGSLWGKKAMKRLVGQVPKRLDRIVVGIDPPVTSHEKSDECGIVVVGAIYAPRMEDWRAYVLEDASMKGTPLEWAGRALALAKDYNADRIVAECNQGGELIETLIRQLEPFSSYSAVRATRSKQARAEPVAALYEQCRVVHKAVFAELETQMRNMTRFGYETKGSPDRLDAMVWALHMLMIEPRQHVGMRVRGLG